MKTIIVTMARPGWNAPLVIQRVLTDVEEPCDVTQIDSVTFEIECGRVEAVYEAINAHPAVKAFEEIQT